MTAKIRYRPRGRGAGRRRARARMTAAGFALLVRAAKLDGGMVLEHRFAAPERQWAFDFAWPAQRVAVEFEGLVWSGPGGRHQRAGGYERDLEKYNEALLRGWRVLRISQRHAGDGRALAWLELLLAQAGEEPPPAAGRSQQLHLQ